MNVCIECGVTLTVISGIEMHMIGCSKCTPEGEELLLSFAKEIERSPSGMMLMAAADRGLSTTMVTLRTVLPGTPKEDKEYLEMLEAVEVNQMLYLATTAGATQMLSILMEQGLINKEAYASFELGNTSSENGW